MNTYIKRDKNQLETKIKLTLMKFERENQMEITGINFIQHSMCNNSRKMVRALDVHLFCHDARAWDKKKGGK